MKQINLVRLILGGLVSGIIIYVIEAVTNAVILGKDWQMWGTVAKTVFPIPSESVSLIHWALQALVAGIAGTFIYAGIRTWAVGWLGMSFDKMAWGSNRPRWFTITFWRHCWPVCWGR